MYSMSIGRVKARAIQKRSFEAVDLMKELQKKYGGDIFFMELDEHGFKIILSKEKLLINVSCFFFSDLTTFFSFAAIKSPTEKS